MFLSMQWTRGRLFFVVFVLFCSVVDDGRLFVLRNCRLATFLELKNADANRAVLFNTKKL